MLAVPNDAIKNVARSRRDGRDARPQGRQRDRRGARAECRTARRGRGPTAAPAGTRGAARGATARGDVALAAQQVHRQQQPQQGSGQGRQQIEVSDKDCAKVNDGLAKKPDREEEARRPAREGALRRARLRGDARSEREALHQRGHRHARGRRVPPQGDASQRRRHGAARERAPATAARQRRAPRAAAASAAEAVGQRRRQPRSCRRPRWAASTRRARPGLVFVADSAKKTFHPRIVQLGAGNFDYTEVVSGLKEGERVVLLGALALQAQRQQQNDRIASGMGVPGLDAERGRRAAGRPAVAAVAVAAAAPRGAPARRRRSAE